MTRQLQRRCQPEEQNRPQKSRLMTSRRKAPYIAMVALLLHRFTSAFVTRISIPGGRTVCKMMSADSRELRFYSGSSILDHPCPEPILAGISRLPDNKRNSNGSARVFSVASLIEAQNRRLREEEDSPSLDLSEEERRLFNLLSQVTEETDISSTLRVAGGWVRDKLLATKEFQMYHRTNKAERLTSKAKVKTTHPDAQQPSKGRQGTKVMITDQAVHPVDIDIALDDMLGREFADHLNEFLSEHGQETVSVGVVLKNPEKSKHLETATMKVGTFWIDFVNLRAEEYTQNSRIPDLMRIGTPTEDAFRRDLTINALFYNINTGRVEDWTGRGIDDLRRGIVATPLAPLTTLLDDPLRVLRSIRFAARLRFAMDDALVEAAKDERVRSALGHKVSRERIGGEVDLMLRSPDPVGAMRLLINLDLVDTVFPIDCVASSVLDRANIFKDGLTLMTTTHDHLCDCKESPPAWCDAKRTVDSATFGVNEQVLMNDEEARRLLWYAAFLKPLMDYSKTRSQKNGPRRHGRKANRSVVIKLLVDELKRPARDAEAVERITKAADDFTRLINSGCDLSAMAILVSDVEIKFETDSVTGEEKLSCMMDSQPVDSELEDHPVWTHSMEFRLLCSKVMQRVGSYWRAALFLSLSEQLASLDDELDYAIEGDVVDESQEERRSGIIERYDAFAAALQQMGLIGIWGQKPLLHGGEMKKVLPNIPKGPGFREVMDEQENWMTTHPCGGKEALTRHITQEFPEYV